MFVPLKDYIDAILQEKRMQVSLILLADCIGGIHPGIGYVNAVKKRTVHINNYPLPLRSGEILFQPQYLVAGNHPFLAGNLGGQGDKMSITMIEAVVVLPINKRFG